MPQWKVSTITDRIRWLMATATQSSKIQMQLSCLAGGWRGNIVCKQMILRWRRRPRWFLNYTFSSGLGETKKLNCISDSQLSQTRLLPWGIVVQQKREIELVPCEEGSRCCGTAESKVTHSNDVTSVYKTGSGFKDNFHLLRFMGTDWSLHLKHAEICVLQCLYCTG